MPRRCGRTTKAIEWVKKDPNRILIVHSEQEKDRLLKLYSKGAGQGTIEPCLDYQQIETFETIRRHYYGPTLRRKLLIIDNIELILNRLIDNPDAQVEGFTCEQPVEDFMEPELFSERRVREWDRWGSGQSKPQWKVMEIPLPGPRLTPEEQLFRDASSAL